MKKWLLVTSQIGFWHHYKANIYQSLYPKVGQRIIEVPTTPCPKYVAPQLNDYVELNK